MEDQARTVDCVQIESAGLGAPEAERRVRREFRRPCVGLVIPTLNAGQRWSQFLEALAMQSLKCRRVLVVDSASTDDTVAKAYEAGADVKRISASEFNHGGTRQWAAEYLSDCDVIVFLTQDAILATPESVSELVRCLEDPMVAVAYGRQIPRLGATAMEAHARLFNYEEVSERKDLSGIGKLGSRAFFCSNSFAAYRRSTLLELGGFRRDLIVGEDAEYAARAILAGYANVFCATALVQHSHDYNLAEVFARYFDTGVFHARNGWMLERFGSHGGRGVRFVKSELSYLARHAPLQIPRAICHTCAKAIGYRLGRFERFLPRRLKSCLSMTPAYWRPVHA